MEFVVTLTNLKPRLGVIWIDAGGLLKGIHGLLIAAKSVVTLTSLKPRIGIIWLFLCCLLEISECGRIVVFF